MSIKRIVLTGDIFRTFAGEGNQLNNIRWLYRRFAPMLQKLTGLTPEIRFRLNAPDEGREVIHGWYKILNAPIGLKGWAETFWSTPTNELISAMAPDYEDALVVSVEMSPLLKGVLDALGTPWIDVGISPKRFLSDLMVTLKASYHFDPHHSPHLLLSTEGLASAIEHVRNYYSSTDTSELAGTCAFFAQTTVDRTLIHEGRIPEAQEIFDHVLPALNGRRLLIKPHPLALNNPLLSMLRKNCSAQICVLNTYTILSSKQDVTALTWSSSVGLEALAFGMPTMSFSPKVQNWAYGGVETLRWGRSVKLWGPLLSAVLPVTIVDELETWCPNELRNELGAFGIDARIWT